MSQQHASYRGTWNQESDYLGHDEQQLAELEAPHRALDHEGPGETNNNDPSVPVQDRDDTNSNPDWRGQSNLQNDSYASAPTPPSFSTRSRSSPHSSLGRNPLNASLTQLYIISNLVFFSLLGTLARLGVQWLTFYSGAPLVTPVLWANVGGSFFMGFLSEDRRVFREEWGIEHMDSYTRQKALEQEHQDPDAFKKAHLKTKKTVPLYIGLATGFCGSFTSFSSFIRDVFLTLSNDLPTPVDHPYSGTAPSFTSTIHRSGGYSFMALLAVIIYTVALSLAALSAGAHLALLLDPVTPTLPFKFTRKFIDPLLVVIAWGCWLGAVFLSIWPPDRPSGSSSRGSLANEVWRGEILFALAFAPVGCLLRYYASLKLNPIAASFPLGTFAVNLFGCAVEAMCYSVQHVPITSTTGALVGGGRVGCQVLQGVMDGFCGATTTVSTWVAELQSLRKRHAYVYGMASVVGGLCFMLVIMGSVRWTVGWSSPACVTMRTSL